MGVLVTKEEFNLRSKLNELNFSTIPVEKMPKSGSVDQSVGGESTVRVFDLDLNEWRSFRVDSLLTFSAI